MGNGNNFNRFSFDVIHDPVILVNLFLGSHSIFRYNSSRLKYHQRGYRVRTQSICITGLETKEFYVILHRSCKRTKNLLK